MQQLAGPASRKVGHEKHDVISHNALVYKNSNISKYPFTSMSHDCFQKNTLTDVNIFAKAYMTKRRKGKTLSALIHLVIFSTMKFCCGYFFWDSLPSRRFWVILTSPFQERGRNLKKATQEYIFVLLSPLLKVHVNKKSPHQFGILELFARERVVITERTYILTRTLSYTPYICCIPLMKHLCWDRVAASPKPC